MKCLHCGDRKPYSNVGYCEKCFQDLIFKNLELQLKVKLLEKKLQHKPKHLKE